MQILSISEREILEMESRKRAAFMNSLTGFKSASLIGTVDAAGQTNLAIFSSVTHLGSNPALIGFINRPDSVDRHTLENILATRHYTINHIHQDIYQQAHQTSARYPKAVSEFAAVGLTAEWIGEHPAPFVQESRIKYGMEYVESHRLEVNGTILVIGKVVCVTLPEACIGTDGAIEVERAGTITISALDRYHTTDRIARLSYAKPEQPPKVLID
jgi:flavin reductase (DIM6/NTAB) family NADH-FMN oxidoreductase RutF